MRPNPAEEWQRLTKLYGEMSDGQLIELAETFGDLTEIAQPILRDEMKKRRLGEPSAPAKPTKDDNRQTFGRWNQGSAEQEADLDAPDEESDESGEGASIEYTWKTQLCDCETSEEAWQVSEVLRLAKIQSWTANPAAEVDMRNIRILVAADQLDEARAVIAKPIPQEIIDQSREKPEDYVPPVCPKCGAPDPTLESVEPIDSWVCEDCGARWSGNPAFGPATSDAKP